MKNHALCGLSLLLASCNFQSPQTLVPKDWYLLPENGNASDSFTTPESQNKLAQQVSRLYSLQTQTIEEAAAEAPLDTPSPDFRPSNWVPWHLQLVQTQLTISSEGILGPLLLEGSASVETIWKKIENHSSNALKLAVNQRAAGTTFHVTRTTLPQFDTAVRAAVDSGRVRDDTRLRQSLIQTARDFREVGRNLNQLSKVLATKGYSWAPTEFRLEIEVNGAGQVVPTGQVGGELRFRFQWEKEEEDDEDKTDPVLKKSDSSKLNDFAARIGAFAETIAPDLDAIAPAITEIEKKGPEFEGIRIGIGISAEGNIGIAKSSVSTSGNIKFEPIKSKTLLPSLEKNLLIREASAPLLLIEKNPPVSHAAFALKNGIPVQNFSMLNTNQPREALYSIRHAAFQNGLKKALALGGFFAHAAQPDPGKPESPHAWKLKELATEFEMSIEGTVGLVTLEGEGSVEIMFEDKKL